MTKWKGIVGRAFGQQEFVAYLAALPPQTWKPKFIVLHNTGIPTIAAWHKVSGARRMAGLQAYYRDEKHWSGGPHLFVADDLIWVFTPLNVPGTHAFSWNPFTLAVEMVGDYGYEDFNAGIGGDVHSNSVFAVAALSMHFGLDSSSMRLHKENPETDHDCPGDGVSKSGFILEVHNKIVELRG